MLHAHSTAAILINVCLGANFLSLSGAWGDDTPTSLHQRRQTSNNSTPEGASISTSAFLAICWPRHGGLPPSLRHRNVKGAFSCMRKTHFVLVSKSIRYEKKNLFGSSPTRPAWPAGLAQACEAGPVLAQASRGATAGDGPNACKSEIMGVSRGGVARSVAISSDNPRRRHRKAAGPPTPMRCCSVQQSRTPCEAQVTRGFVPYELRGFAEALHGGRRGGQAGRAAGTPSVLIGQPTGRRLRATL